MPFQQRYRAEYLYSFTYVGFQVVISEIHHQLTHGASPFTSQQGLAGLSRANRSKDTVSLLRPSWLSSIQNR